MPLAECVIADDDSRARHRPGHGRPVGRRDRAGQRSTTAPTGCATRSRGHRGHDICFIDCPPSLGLLTLNALTAADTLLVPLQCEFFALEGLSQLLQTVERVQQRFNPDLGIIGVALTMFDRRNRLTDQVADDVRSCLGRLVFESVIPRNVRLSEAPSHGLPALVYDHACAGSRAYMALARELIGRLPEGKESRMSDDPIDPHFDAAEPAPQAQAAALGRGLGALLGETRREEPLVAPAREPRPTVGSAAGSDGLASLPVAAIEPHPEQPRRHFDEAALDELAASIAAARRDPAGDRPPARRRALPAGRRRTPLARRAEGATP